MRGEAGGRAIRQSRQLPAVAARQMATHQTDLLLDKIEIVEKPGLCRRDPLSRGGCGRDDVIRRQHNTRIVRQPWQQPVRPRMRIDVMLPRQRYRVTLQLLNTEQLRTQQFSIALTTHALRVRAENPNFLMVIIFSSLELG